MGKVVKMKEIPYAEFIQDWEKGLILEVQSTADKLIGKSVKGQADNPRGFIMVYCMVPTGKLKKPLWRRILRR